MRMETPAVLSEHLFVPGMKLQHLYLVAPGSISQFLRSGWFAWNAQGKRFYYSILSL